MKLGLTKNLLLACALFTLGNHPAWAIESCSVAYSKIGASLDLEAESLPEGEAKAKFRAALEKYYGPEAFRRPRDLPDSPDPFEAIWQDFKATADSDSRWADRAFRARDEGKSFSVAVEGNGHGLDVKRPELDAFVGRWKKNLEEEVGEWMLLPNDKARSQKVVDSLALWDQKTQLMLSKKSSLPRKDAEKLSADFYAEMKSDPNFRRASAWIMREELEQRATQLSLSGDADELIGWWDDARAGRLWGNDEAIVPPSLRSSVGAVTTPKLELPSAVVELDKPAESELFRTRAYLDAKGKLRAVGATNGELEIVPVRRRFACIFKGIFNQECVGGGFASFRSLTPERWSTCLLEGSLYFNVQKGGRYQGFVQVVPVKIDGKTYGSVELGSTAFARSRALTEKVLEELRSQVPKGWAGLTVSESHAMSQSVASPAIWESPAYLLGEELRGKAEVVDNISRSITKGRARAGYAQRYGGAMITDATIRDAGKLIRLNVESEAVLKDRLKDPETLWAVAGAGGRKLEGLARYLEREPISDAERSRLLGQLEKAWREKKISANSTVILGRALATPTVPFPLLLEPSLRVAAQWLRLRKIAERNKGEFVNKIWNLRSRL